MPFQHTAARRRLDVLGYLDIRRSLVSTHSRPKAAVEGGIRAEVIESFNTQPPEGGWGILLTLLNTWLKFQHTAARRRLLVVLITEALVDLFQHTAARRRL